MKNITIEYYIQSFFISKPKYKEAYSGMGDYQIDVKERFGCNMF